MFYDLNVPWSSNHAELQRILAFLRELGYDVVALNHTVTGKLPNDLTSPIPETLSFPVPAKLHVLRRVTVLTSEPPQNARLTALANHYDIVAVRPVTEKALQQTCQNLDCDLISLDLSTRFPFYFRHKSLQSAISRGVKFEICYAAGVFNADGGISRRNLIQNATALIRATRGRGVVLSSEATRALACRAPFDVINLATVWGLGSERGCEAVGRESRAVCVQARMKRTSYRGVVDIVYGGHKPQRTRTADQVAAAEQSKGKRKADVLELRPADDSQDKPVSKREMKRRAKKAKLEAASKEDAEVDEGSKHALNAS